MTQILPPELLAQLKPRQRQQVKRAEAALAKLPVKPRAPGVDLSGGVPAPADPVEWLTTLWPQTFTGELAPFHVEFLEWLFARDVSQSAAGVFVWPRGFSKTTLARRAPIALATRGYRYILYVQAKQSMADDSVQNIGNMLSHPLIARHYPQLAEPMTSKHGTQQGWRRNRVWTAGGLVIDAAGLDVAVRGLNLDDMRPDVIVFDDIDGKHDSLKTTEKKLKTIQSSIIPAGAANRVVLVMQNIINPHGVVTRLADANKQYPAQFLMDRHVSGPFPAVEGLEYEMKGRNAQGRPIYAITAGVSTWPSVRNIPALEQELNLVGPDEFIEELQNEVGSQRGSLYNGYDFDTVDAEDFDFEDIQVWCDIAVTAHDGSDSQAISAAGRATDGTVVTLYAWEGVEATSALMERAILKAVELRASTLGIETNQGGDLWKDAFNHTWTALAASGRLPIGTPKPRYEEVKASTATGGKRERWQMAKGMRERGELRDAVGTHEARFRSLKRLPEIKPYDLADADAWSAIKLAKPKKAGFFFRSG